MAEPEGFLRYLEEQVNNHSVYVWGAQGQKDLTERWIRARETSPENADAAVRYWKRQVAAGYEPVLRAFDCSGLGVYYLRDLIGLLPRDVTADGLYRLCRRIGGEELRPGDFAFRLNAEGKAVHVGYVADAARNVIEARGRAYGVVKRPLARGGWQAYGRPSFWEEEPPAGGEGAADGEAFLFRRALRHGCRGEDVRALKRLLARAGFGGLDPENPNFYGNTKRTVLAFQQRAGLEPDGVAGKKTIAALGGRARF